MRIAYLNKKFMPLDKAKVSILDRGFLYGDGAFETLRSYNGVVFLLEKHLERLFKSLKALGITSPLGQGTLQKIVYNLLKRNKLEDAYIKIIITRGKIKPTAAIYVLPYKELPKSIYRKGIKVCVSKTRFCEKTNIAGHKTLNYLENIMSRFDAKRKGFSDAMLINSNDFVGEATSSNIFLVKKGKISTPCLQSGVLPGIIRAEIIRLSRLFLRCNVEEDFIKLDALHKANEIFLTNSMAEIVPVVKIDNHVIGKGTPGAVTKRLMELFRCSVNEYYRRYKYEK